MPPDDAVRLPDDLVRDLVEAEAEAHPETRHQPLTRVCRAATTTLHVSGSAVHLIARDGASHVAAVHPPTVAPLADLAFTLGEGPTMDAFLLRRPVLAAELGTFSSRWPGFTQAAAEVGLQSVLSFPLQVGGLSLGVLDLYSRRLHALDGRGTALALAFADLATEIVLDGPLGREPEGGPRPTPDQRAEIHQAQGMVMIDLRVDMREALVRMRAHAFREGMPLADLARSIIRGARLPDAGSDTP